MLIIREFIKSGGLLTDLELTARIREHVETMSAPERKEWVQQIELSFDGYGGPTQLAAVARVRSALKRMGVEISPLATA